MRPMQDRTFCMSFGKMLEMMMYSVPACPLHATCDHSVFEHHTLCFGWNDEAGSGDMSELQTVFRKMNISIPSGFYVHRKRQKTF